MSSAPAAGRPKDLPAYLGGYRVVRELGRGRLGAVVLAGQPATGNRVALRVLKPEWACLPKYVSRLTRSAFAAEQVEHPNVVRLVEFGEAQGRFFFASEFVDSTSLDGIVKGQGALTVPQAVAHVLQAARGLRFAHGQGLAHGDVRAENLFVNSDGQTRLADLGLFLTPATVEAEEARDARGPIAVGAEAQAETDAAPFRSDVRGLGLTLAYLLTGKGETHPTALIAAGLPMNLVELVRGMAEAKPGGSFANLGQVVPALERFLNARGPSTTTPREDDTAVLTECLNAFRASPSATLRRRIIWGAVAAFALLVLLGLVVRQPLFAFSVLGLGLMTALADFVVAGIKRQSPLFPKVRALILGSRGGDWLIGLGAVVVFAAGLVALRLQWAWIAFGVLAIILAAWLHVAVGGKVAAERRGALEEARALLKRLRLQGVAEETLQRFVRTTAGDDWEEIFEALFGFEAMLAAREPSERGVKGLVRGRVTPLRSAISSWIDDRQASRRLEREWVLIQAIEERALVAEGVNLVTARRKARRIAEAMVAVSAQIRAAARPSGAEIDDRPTIASAVRQAAETLENVLIEQESGLERADYSGLLDLVYGPRTRFLLGSAVLAGFLIWVHQNQVISQEQITDVASRALEAPDPLNVIQNARIDVRLDGATKPLRLAFLPRPVANLLSGFPAGVAGLILVVSSLLGGSRVGWFTVPGAAVAMLGPWFGVAPTLAMAIGAGVAALGLFFGRSPDD